MAGEMEKKIPGSEGFSHTTEIPEFAQAAVTNFKRN
jgi:hypothetical protein